MFGYIVVFILVGLVYAKLEYSGEYATTQSKKQDTIVSILSIVLVSLTWSIYFDDKYGLFALIELLIGYLIVRNIDKKHSDIIGYILFFIFLAILMQYDDFKQKHAGLLFLILVAGIILRFIVNYFYSDLSKIKYDILKEKIKRLNIDGFSEYADELYTYKFYEIYKEIVAIKPNSIIEIKNYLSTKDNKHIECLEQIEKIETKYNNSDIIEKKEEESQHSTSSMKQLIDEYNSKDSKKSDNLTMEEFEKQLEEDKEKLYAYSGAMIHKDYYERNLKHIEKYSKIDTLSEEDKKGIIQHVDKEIETLHKQYNTIFLGYCHLAWKVQKGLLKHYYKINWQTPAEENPDVMYD